MLRLTQRMVERLGYRSLIARSGRDAIGIAQASEGKIRLTLIDIEAPEMDELEIYSLLATVRPEMKVILYGSYEMLTFLDRNPLHGDPRRRRAFVR